MLNMNQKRLKNEPQSRLFITVICLVSFCLCSCGKKDYHRLVAYEKAKGIRQDSLFLGISIGMDSERFYKHCWDLNKKGLIREGMASATIHYSLPETNDKIKFEFYPVFKEGKVQSMTGYFYHTAWAPWSKETFPDFIIEETKELLSDWYNVHFVPIARIGMGKTYAAVKGNLRIVLYYKQDTRVEVLFTDLTNDDGFLTIPKSAKSK